MDDIYEWLRWRTWVVYYEGGQRKRGGRIGCVCMVEAKKRALSYSVDPQLLSSPVGFELSLSLSVCFYYSLFIFYFISSKHSSQPRPKKTNKTNNKICLHLCLSYFGSNKFEWVQKTRISSQKSAGKKKRENSSVEQFFVFFFLSWLIVDLREEKQKEICIQFHFAKKGKGRFFFSPLDGT